MKLIKEQWNIPHTHSPALVLKDYHPFSVPKQNVDASDLIAGRKLVIQWPITLNTGLSIQRIEKLVP